MKNKIINAVKLFVLIVFMYLGFFLFYGAILSVLGIPVTAWTAAAAVVLSGATEILYFMWVVEVTV